jgi:hypothetical protein
VVAPAAMVPVMGIIRVTVLGACTVAASAGAATVPARAAAKISAGARRSSADKRVKIVALTPAGIAAVELSRHIIAETERRWSEALGAERYR